MSNGTSYQLRVEFEAGSQSVGLRREMMVPGRITLDFLHDALQVLMGWNDSHLHEFAFEGRRFENGDAVDFGQSTAQDEREVPLDSLLRKPGQKMTYLYDFNAKQRLLVTLLSVEDLPDGHFLRVMCLSGEGVETDDVTHAGASHDVGSFDMEATQQELDKLVHWARPRSAAHVQAYRTLRRNA